MYSVENCIVSYIVGRRCEMNGKQQKKNVWKVGKNRKLSVQRAFRTKKITEKCRQKKWIEQINGNEWRKRLKSWRIRTSVKENVLQKNMCSAGSL